MGGLGLSGQYLSKKVQRRKSGVIGSLVCGPTNAEVVNRNRVGWWIVSYGDIICADNGTEFDYIRIMNAQQPTYMLWMFSNVRYYQ